MQRQLGEEANHLGQIVFPRLSDQKPTLRLLSSHAPLLPDHSAEQPTRNRERSAFPVVYI